VIICSREEAAGVVAFPNNQLLAQEFLKKGLDLFQCKKSAENTMKNKDYGYVKQTQMFIMISVKKIMSRNGCCYVPYGHRRSSIGNKAITDGKNLISNPMRKLTQSTELEALTKYRSFRM